MNSTKLPLLGQIARLNDKIFHLKKTVQWYQQNLEVLVEILRANKIQYDMTFKYLLNMEEEEECIDQDEESIPTVAERMNNPILNELIDISGRTQKKIEYTPQYKAFAYSLYFSSELCYRSICQYLPFPCESCLRKNFQESVKNLESDLSSIEKVESTLLKISAYFESKIINCTLVIDAFTTSLIKPYSKKRYLDDDKNNCFLFLIEPHKKNCKVFPIFLYQSQSGMADNLTIDYIKRIIEISKKTTFKIKYTSVDGDKFYQIRFIEHYKLITEIIKKTINEDVFILINETLGFQIADFLHLLKNARSRILKYLVVINPFQHTDYLDYYSLLNDENINYLIHDTSTLAKLRDELPRSLFRFELSFYIQENYSPSTFFYFLVYSLWNEATYNTSIGPQTRKYFLLIILNTLLKLQAFYKEKQFDANVFEKKGKDHKYISFITMDKIIRIINTLDVLIKEIIEAKDDSLALSRLSSHPIENFIGRIRSLCHDDNRFCTILHNVARYELIVRDFDTCYLQFKPSHSSPGGTYVNQIGNEMDFTYKPEEIADWLLESVKLGKTNKENHLSDFLEKLQFFSQNNPYPVVKLPSETTGQKIVNRFYSQNKCETKIWTQNEIKLIDDLLLSNNEKLILSKKYFNCSKEEKLEIINQRKAELQNRDWTTEEDSYILAYIKKEIKLQQLRAILILRENKSIMERKDYLIQKQNWSKRSGYKK